MVESRIKQLFFELIQITLGNRDAFSWVPSETEWGQLYLLAQKQSLGSWLLDGVNRYKNLNSNEKLCIEQKLLLEWIGQQQVTIHANSLHNERAKELCELYKKGGFRSCVLKGQGTALYYNNPSIRQCGDIDIWVDGDRDVILDFARNHGWKIGHIDIKHSDIEIFKDVPVEVHFLPSWMYFPTTNNRLQKFFECAKEREFTNIDVEHGFVHTTIDFDLVYSMVHIYRHIFSEGVGLRQLVDYYYILQHSSAEQRKDAFDNLRRMRMSSFAGGVMKILCECFGMKEEYLLCPINKRHGEFLLSEIMTAGNFGKFDNRTVRVDVNKRFTRGFTQLGRNLRFVSYYPTEVLWSPFWKLWHWAWRKRKGYL